MSAASKPPTNKLSLTTSRAADFVVVFFSFFLFFLKITRFICKIQKETRAHTSDGCCEEALTRMAYHSQGMMEHISLVRPLALHGISMDNSGAHRQDALRLGLPCHLDAYFDPVHGQRLPCRRFSYIPFHGPLGVCDYSFEPAFIRKRNERERHRVRCVNEGYARLREHLPHEFDDKRLSKVETLRAAIDYIKHLQNLLDVNVSGVEVSLGGALKLERLQQSSGCTSDGETQTSLSESGDVV
ncbi:achaete-scute homolog 4 isoform X2 [Simochromis diagramma]|uniref:achaete-scute homolog 4 isoform X2 n=1 Tax=Simochromis diagramma TaxID=43689 RepID=UPI001A7E688B|nr:achaete-scute homolog 4 isoform X2 [Simochromis diagramma]